MKSGEKIKMLRESKKLSRRELAESSGVSESAIKQYEMGTRNARTEQLQMLASVFHVDLDYLIKDDLGLSGRAQEMLKHRQRHKDADVTVDGVCSSYKKIDSATDAVLNHTGFLAAIAEYIHTPEAEESEVSYYTPNADLVETWMTPQERQAFYSGLIVQKLPELKKKLQEADHAEEKSP